MKKIVRNRNKENEIRKILGRYKAYKAFSENRKDAYRVAELYDVKVCPYCNINYTYAVYTKDKFVCRPDFDHFSLKSKNKNLALDIDNLVPCCQQCNSRVKLRKFFFLKTHVHPFFDDFDSLADFLVDVENVGLIHKEENFKILCLPQNGVSLLEKKKVRNSIRELGIEERYQFHKDVVGTIIKHGYLYNKYRCEEIGSLVDPGQGINYAALSLLFPDIDCDINKTSLGKLKRDVSRKIKECVSK